MDGHLDFDRIDKEKVAKLLEARCNEVMQGTEQVLAPMVLGAVAMGGLCMCHTVPFLERLIVALNRVKEDVAGGAADKQPRTAREVADRLLTELFTRPLKSEGGDHEG